MDDGMDPPKSAPGNGAAANAIRKLVSHQVGELAQKIEERTKAAAAAARLAQTRAEQVGARVEQVGETVEKALERVEAAAAEAERVASELRGQLELHDAELAELGKLDDDLEPLTPSDVPYVHDDPEEEHDHAYAETIEPNLARAVSSSSEIDLAGMMKVPSASLKIYEERHEENERRYADIVNELTEIMAKFDAMLDAIYNGDADQINLFNRLALRRYLEIAPTFAKIFGADLQPHIDDAKRAKEEA